MRATPKMRVLTADKIVAAQNDRPHIMIHKPNRPNRWPQFCPQARTLVCVHCTAPEQTKDLLFPFFLPHDLDSFLLQTKRNEFKVKYAATQRVRSIQCQMSHFEGS